MNIDELFILLPVLEKLQAARGAAGETVWLVGGSVRDLLLERTPADLDLALEQPEPLARRFAEITGGKLVAIDGERGYWRVVPAGELTIDFCPFRAREIIGDLRGRDFTLNAIALRLPEPGKPAELLDPFGGIDDLNAGILRAVTPEAFHDDPLRLLRAFRFMAELGYRLDAETWVQLLADVERLLLSAPERVIAEWWKLCAGTHAPEAIQRMEEVGLLGVLFPELQATKGVMQNAYHHLDVWEHSLLAAGNLARCFREPEETFQELLPFFAPLLDDAHRRARLFCAALLHDIGKPTARTEKAGEVHFYRHEVLGAEMADEIAHRLRMSNADSHALTGIIRQHLRPLLLRQARQHGELSRKSMIHFFNKVGDCAPEVLALALADISATQGPAASPTRPAELLALYRELWQFYRHSYQPALAKPLLSGHDLITQLHLSPGPRLGRLLARARELQMEGKLTSREEALRLVNEWVNG